MCKLALIAKMMKKVIKNKNINNKFKIYPELDVVTGMQQILRCMKVMMEMQNRMSKHITTIAQAELAILNEQKAFMQHAPLMMEIVQKRRHKVSLNE